MHGLNPIAIAAWLKETEEDDQRRRDQLKGLLTNKKLLDFGCGNGGFLFKAESLAEKVSGVEPEKRVIDKWIKRLNIYPDIKSVQGKYDLITAFHVVEHLSDPAAVLKQMSKLLADGGQIVIEVPNSEDALLTLYQCDAFQKFTYWSQHLYLFNSNTLNLLAKKSGLKVFAIQHIQRYPISNHFYWLSKGKPGGHKQWAFIDSPGLNDAYARSLGSLGKTDTIMAYLGKQ